jgi:transposase InsO family protein
VAQPVAAAGLHADGRGTLGTRISVGEGGEGCNGFGTDGGAFGRISALRLSVRIAIFLARDGYAMSFGRAHRLWRQAQLQVPRKRPRKRIATGRPRPNSPTGANQVWSYDFVFDACANGQQLKCLTVTDEWTKEGLAIEVD